MLPSFIPLATLLAAIREHTTAIGLLTTLAALLFLVQKEISGSLRGPRAQRLAQTLDVALVPLLVIFVINAFLMIAAAIR